MQIFPFGLPPATAFYLALYVLTFALHHALMHYVLAGSIYVAFVSLLSNGEGKPRLERPLAATIRDWMPFFLSAAITAGVAPLLFVQIVYPKHFYTANLLLSWRWMIVVPLLIIAFYLLYLLKTSRWVNWPRPLRGSIATIIAGSFVFVGFCWTANHLLAAREATWPEFYLTGVLPVTALEVTTRMLIWIGGSFATLAAIVAWQFRWRFDPAEVECEAATRYLAGSAIVGMLVAGIASGCYLAQLPAESRSEVLSGSALPYLALGGVGVLGQLAAWGMSLRRASLTLPLRLMATTGVTITLVSSAVIRETIRLTEVDVSKLTPAHVDAAKIDGFTVFLAFAVLNTVLIAFCVWLVRKGLRNDASTAD